MDDKAREKDTQLGKARIESITRAELHRWRWTEGGGLESPLDEIVFRAKTLADGAGTDTNTLADRLLEVPRYPVQTPQELL